MFLPLLLINSTYEIILFKGLWGINIINKQCLAYRKHSNISMFVEWINVIIEYGNDLSMGEPCQILFMSILQTIWSVVVPDQIINIRKGEDVRDVENCIWSNILSMVGLCKISF